VLKRGGRGVRSPVNELARHADEREAETAYHAEKDVKFEQPMTVTGFTSFRSCALC
jgi:hypothetical protein